MVNDLKPEDMLRYKPSVTEVMSAVFQGYEFFFCKEKMDVSEVFANNGFLPVLSHISCARIESLIGIDFNIESENSAHAILGVEINPIFGSPSASMIYMMSMMTASCEIFGDKPGLIDLDALYEWSIDEAVQKNGLPYLGG
jgi:hypothetical protein